MHDQLRSNLAPRKFYQHNLQSGLSAMFHSWNTIRIVGYQNDAINPLIACIRRDIQANSHINSFLLEISDEIGISELRSLVYWRVFWLVSTKL